MGNYHFDIVGANGRDGWPGRRDWGPQQVLRSGWLFDYDPMPHELALRASYAAQGYVVRNIPKHAADELNTIAADLKLFGDV